MPAGTPYALGRFRWRGGDGFCRVVIGANKTHVVELMVAAAEKGDHAPERTFREATALMTERAEHGTPYVFVSLPSAVCGPHCGRYLRPGDVMESTITGLGLQRNRCVEP